MPAPKSREALKGEALAFNSLQNAAELDKEALSVS
jgi:hypothetical protein